MFAALGLHSFPIANGEQLCHARNISRVLCPQSTPSAEEDGLNEDGCLGPSQGAYPTIHISKRIIQISVKRDPDGSLGFTLCGGAQADSSALSRPLFVSHIRRGGPVHREGSVRPGDRLLAVDGHSMEHVSFAEAQSLLQHHGHCERWKGEDNLDCNQGSHPCCSGECYTLLVVEYDVVEREGLSELRGPLLVELQLDYPDEELGLSLAVLPEDGPLSPQKRSAALIEAVRPASIAERCGALHSGDILLAIGKIHHRDDNRKKEGNVAGPHNSTSRQSWAMHIEVLPLSQMDRPPSARVSDCESNGSKKDLTHSADSHVGCVASQSQCSDASSSSGSLVWNGPQRWPPLPPTRESSEHILPQIIGCESSAIHDVPCEEISNLEAFLQSTNFRDSNDSEKMILWQRRSLLSFGAFDLDCAHTSDIQEGSQDQISFTRLKSIPWFGANNENLEGRCSLHVGDADCGSNGVNVSTSCFQLKDYAGDAVVHVVQVARNGGPLGITLSGTEDPSEHITISGLVEGGPARCTAALQVGDRLLAVGGESLDGRPLSEAVALLRAASDPVVLHVARPSSLSVDRPFVANGINNPRTPACGLEIEDSFLPRFTNVVARINTEVDEPADIHAGANTHSPGTICSCPSANCHQPSLKHCNSSQIPSSTVNELHGPLLYELGPQLSHSSQSSVGTVGSMRRGQNAQPTETLHITLFKDGIYEDFGFSVSDGLYERGVYVNRIRKGGPADVASLQPYDRIIQVNDTITYAFDCCLTVPLIASAGDKIDLTVVRCPISEVKKLSY